MSNTRELSQLASLLVVNDETRNIGIGTTNPISKLDVGGNLNVSGVVTATGGFNIGIQSAGTNVTTGVITALNFVGTGNTFTYNTGTKTVDISIAGGSGGSQVSVGTASPASPSSGNLWYNSNLGRTFIYYNDGDSSQWVDAAPFNIVSDSSSAASVSIGTEAPVGPTSGDLWYNADYARIFVYYDNGINSQWVDAAPFNIGSGSGGGASVSIGVTSPVGPTSGDLWYSTDYARIFIYYDDQITSQWVDAAPFNYAVVDGLSISGSGYVLGNLGIGTTSPSTKLHVVGDTLISGVTTSQNGFTSGIGVTNPVKIAVSGNTLTFTVVGVGSTSLRLY